MSTIKPDGIFPFEFWMEKSFILFISVDMGDDDDGDDGEDEDAFAEMAAEMVYGEPIDTNLYLNCFLYCFERVSVGYRK